MTYGEFRKLYNVREVEKCCATCRHGKCPWGDGVFEFHHPDLEGGCIINIGEDVCDVWEGKKTKKA